jgi:hypothetical protein
LPAGHGWIHELKHDGFRILAFKDGDAVRLWSRNGRDWSAEFVAITAAIRALPFKRVMLDGEAMAHCLDGLPGVVRLAQKAAEQTHSSGKRKRRPAGFLIAGALVVLWFRWLRRLARSTRQTRAAPASAQTPWRSSHPLRFRVMHGHSGAAERATSEVALQGELFARFEIKIATVPARGSSAAIRNRIHSGNLIGRFVWQP